MRALAVSIARPLEQAPNALPIAKRYPGFEMSSWNGFFVPARTPDAIVARLADAIADSVRDPMIAARLAKFGIQPVGDTPAHFAETIKGEEGLYKEAVEAAGLAIQR